MFYLVTILKLYKANEQFPLFYIIYSFVKSVLDWDSWKTDSEMEIFVQKVSEELS